METDHYQKEIEEALIAPVKKLNSSIDDKLSSMQQGVLDLWLGQ